MDDIHVRLDNVPGALASFGRAMGAAGVNLEGGGVFTVGEAGHAHFLVDDGTRARAAAESAGMEVVAVRSVLVRRLNQARTGEVGAICSALKSAGVNIETMYSDHANQLILVTDNAAAAEAATAAWRP